MAVEKLLIHRIGRLGNTIASMWSFYDWEVQQSVIQLRKNLTKWQSLKIIGEI